MNITDGISIVQIFFYIIGLCFILLSFYRLHSYKRLESWVSIPAIIDKITEKSFSLSAGYSSATLDFNYPVLTFIYFYERNEFSSSKVSLNISNIWIPMLSNEVTERYNRRFWYTWKKGTKIKAFVNPKKPWQAILVKKVSSNFSETTKTLFASGLLIFIFSYFGLPLLTNLAR